MKKILAIVLAVVMLLPVFAVNVFAADDKPMNLVVTSGRVTLKLADVVKAGESVEIHLAGTTDGAFRFCLSDAASKGGSWDQSALEIVTAANERIVEGAFDVTATVQAKADAQYLLISTGASWQFGGEEPFTNLVIETVEANGVAVDLGTLDISNGAATLEEKPLEEVVAYDNPEGIALDDAKNPWDFFGMGGLWGRDAATVLDSVSNDQLKEILNAGGYTFSYVCGNASGWSGTPKAVINGNFDNGVPFKTKDIGDGKYECSIKLDTVVSKWTSLGKTIDEITSFVIQHDLGNIVLYSAKFVPGEPVEEEPQDVVIYEYEANFDCEGSWNSAPVLTVDDSKGVPSPAELQAALTKENAVLEISITNAKGSVQLVFQNSDSWTWSTFYDDNFTGDKTITFPAATIAAKGIDITNIKSLCVNGQDPFTLATIRVIVPAPKVDAKKPVGDFAFVYMNDQLHAYSFGAKFIPMPHVDNGVGYCKYCYELMPASEPADKTVLNLEKTGGQDTEGEKLADGLLLEDKQEASGNCRIATNWVGGGAVWNDIMKALPTEGAWLKVTYTGALKEIIFQTANSSAPEAFEITAPALVEEGDQNVAWFNCADIVANSPIAMSGDLGGWANLMLSFEGDTTVYGFEVIVPLEAPGASSNVEAA